MVGFLFQVVKHLVTMIRTEWNAILACPLQRNQFLHHGIHVYITVKVIRFKKVSFFIAGGASQVNEIDSLSEAAYYSRQIIIRPYSERSCAKAKPVVA